MFGVFNDHRCFARLSRPSYSQISRELSVNTILQENLHLITFGLYMASTNNILGCLSKFLILIITPEIKRPANILSLQYKIIPELQKPHWSSELERVILMKRNNWEETATTRVVQQSSLQTAAKIK